MDLAAANAPPAPAPSPSEILEEFAARAERRLNILAELADIGMALARELRPVAPRAPAAADSPGNRPDAICVVTTVPSPVIAASDGRPRGRDPAETFAGLSRAIRLTLALEATTEEALRDLRLGVVREREGEETHARQQAKAQAEQAAEQRRREARERVVEALEFEIAAPEVRDGFLAPLNRALYEKLDRHDLLVRPMREIVEILCKAIDLKPDWRCWSGQGWAAPGHAPAPRPTSTAADQATGPRLE